MTFGQLFTAMHPDVRTIENGSCVWLFIDEVNHYTIANEWWNQEVTGYALELLKEQEPVEPKKIPHSITYPGSTYICGNCKIEILEPDDNFCPYCGKAVKWDG